MKIEKNGESVAIYLNSKFYGVEALQKAIKDFRKVCAGEISNNSKEFVVRLSPINKETDIENLAYEFCNYVISVMRDSIL